MSGLRRGIYPNGWTDQQVAAAVREDYPILDRQLRGRAAELHAAGQIPLCDVDGIVRRGIFYNGTDYPCTGWAHYQGQTIECSNPIHAVKPVTPDAASADPPRSMAPSATGGRPSADRARPQQSGQPGSADAVSDTVSLPLGELPTDLGGPAVLEYLRGRAEMGLPEGLPAAATAAAGEQAGSVRLGPGQCMDAPPGWSRDRVAGAERMVVGPGAVRARDAVRLQLWGLGGQQAMDELDVLLDWWQNGRPASESVKTAGAWREFRSLLVEHLTGPVDATCCWLVAALDWPGEPHGWRWRIASLASDARDRVTADWGRLRCRLFGVHGRCCRGRPGHDPNSCGLTEDYRAPEARARR